MKKEKLTDAIGMIKDEYIEEAHQKIKRFDFKNLFSWNSFGKLAAAGLCLFMAISIIPGMFHKAASGGYYAANEKADQYYAPQEAYVSDEAVYDSEAAGSYTANSSATSSSVQSDQNKKLILTGNLELEVLDLDELCAKVSELTESYGGYVQNSSVSSRTSSRYYNATIRIPAESYSDFLADLKDSGQQLSYAENVDDITDRYTDIEAQLNSLKAQEAKVIEFYDKAETIEDLMAVESRLSDIRYQIEYLEAQIKNYDLLTAYSTLNISAVETKVYTPVNNSFFTRLKNAFVNGFKNFFNSLGDFFIDVVYNLWTIIFLAVIAFLGYKAYRRIRNRKNS